MRDIMSARKILPVLLVLLFAAGVVVFVLLAGGGGGRSIGTAVFLHVREQLEDENRKEGRDFTIGKLDILSETETEAIVEVPLDSTHKDLPTGYLLELEFSGGDWSVKRDLRKDFTRIATGKEFVRDVAGRLRQRYADRYRLSVTIKEGTAYTVEVVRAARQVVGTFEFRFSIPRSDGRYDRGIYNERFVYDGKEWVRQGRGQLLEDYAPR